MTSGARGDLRVGLLIDSLVQPAWVRQTIENVQASGIAGIAAVILHGDVTEKAETSTDKESGQAYFLYRVYAHWDQSHYQESDDPFMPVDLRAILEASPAVREGSVGSGPDLDVLFCFIDALPNGATAARARSGVWRFRADGCGANAGLWAVMRRRPVVVARVTTSAGAERENEICRCVLSPHPESARLTRRILYWRAPSLFARALSMLADGRSPRVPALSDGPAAPVEDCDLPTNRRFLAPLAGLACRAVGSRLKARLMQDQWFLACRFGDERLDRWGGGADLRVLEPPRGHFWADPFPVHWKDDWYVFFEDATYTPRKGRIAFVKIDQSGAMSEPEVVLEQPYHMSYPFVFRYEGAFYMIPETSADASLDLYRCLEFPGTWEHHVRLMSDVTMADATLCEVGGRWWMFAAVRTDRSVAESELHLFYADSPFGPWTPHKGNAVVSDIRCARPAGKLFSRNGKLFRPGQDSSAGVYGRAIVIQEVLRLDENNYEETTVARIDPNWMRGLTATHTLNNDGGLSVIDGRRWIAKR